MNSPESCLRVSLCHHGPADYQICNCLRYAFLPVFGIACFCSPCWRAEAVQARPGGWIMSKSPKRSSGPLAPSIFSRGKTLSNRWRRSWRISRWAWTKRVTFFRDRVHGRSPDCCSVPNRENLVFRRLPLEADEVINDLEEKRQRPGCAVWWRSAGVVAIQLDAVIREKAWARTAGP